MIIQSMLTSYIKSFFVRLKVVCLYKAIKFNKWCISLGVLLEGRMIEGGSKKTIKSALKGKNWGQNFIEIKDLFDGLTYWQFLNWLSPPRN